MNSAADIARDQMSPLMKAIAILSLGMAVLMVTVDQFIVNVSISTIGGELGVSDNNATWSITAYTVASGIAIPLSGWLTKRFGWVKVLTASVIGFTFFSWMCGIAWNLPILILMRVCQGAVGGPLLPLGQAILLYLMPKNRGMCMGIFGLIVMVGPALGPVLGGWITYNYGWRPIFFINIPIGVLAAILMLYSLLSVESLKEKMPFDGLGFLLFAVGIGCLQVMLDKGYDWDWFRSNAIISLGLISLIFLVYFVIWEIYHPNPVLHLKQFSSGNFTFGTILICIGMSICFVNFVVGPLWVQGQLGYPQTWSGLTLAPVGMTAIICFPLVGHFLHILDSRIWVLISFITIFLSFFIQSRLNIHTPFSYISLAKAILGIGFATFYVPLATITLGNIKPSELAHASSLFASARMICVGAGISIGENYWLRTSNFFQSRYAELMIPSNPAFAPYIESLTKVTGLKGLAADAFIYKLMINQAMTDCFFQLCYISGLLLIPTSLLLLLIRPVEERGAPSVSLE